VLSILKPKGFTRCKCEPEAKAKRPMFPVLFGISGSIKTILSAIIF
jgi:hypothetical protein